MSRRRVAAKRMTLPDPKYHSEMLAKFINHVMLSGKKSIAEKIVYHSLDIIIDKSKKSNSQDNVDEGSSSGSKTHKQVDGTALDVLEQALENIRPTLEVRPRRVGGATYQVPMEVRQDRQNTLAMRWLVACARSRGEKGMATRLAHEILDALSNRGSAVKKREEMHRMAKANQAFAHFRWN